MSITDPKVKQYISAQLKERHSILSAIHSVILKKDKTVVPIVEPMMGKAMILYKDKGMMKYGLASMKQYLSLHVLPIYGSKSLYDKYKSLLPKANFQKGCINFNSAEEMPLEIVTQLIADCSKIDLVAEREKYLEAKKAKAQLKK